MKILYIDIVLDGHHRAYLEALITNADYDVVLALPEKLDNIQYEQYVFSTIDFSHKSLRAYLKWLREIKQIADKEKPDIIHFLYGDVFYKFFAIGLKKLSRKYKTIITLHAQRKGRVLELSLKNIFHSIANGIVHTHVICESLQNIGIKNVCHIEYPCFVSYERMKKETARDKLILNQTIKIIGCFGGTRYDKGLDLLFEALKIVKLPYELLIAGKPETWDENDVKAMAGKKYCFVHTILKYLTDEEFQTAIAACDIIALPYRKIFNGASGPLTEGVWNQKVIIGPDHGSLGQIIQGNHIGYTFISEDTNDLAQIIETALLEEFEYDDVAQKYRESLSVIHFKKKYSSIYEELSI